MERKPSGLQCRGTYEVQWSAVITRTLQLRYNELISWDQPFSLLQQNTVEAPPLPPPPRFSHLTANLS